MKNRLRALIVSASVVLASFAFPSGKAGVSADEADEADEHAAAHVMSVYEAAGQTIPDGTYWIFSSLDPNYFIDIPGTEMISENEVNVKMYLIDKEKNPDQTALKYDAWTIKYLNNGFYKIKQYGSNMCLDVNGSSMNSGANVWMYGDNGTKAQQWSIGHSQNGYKIQSRANSFCLDVEGAKVECETNIQIYEGNETKAQVFYMIPAPFSERPSVSRTDGVRGGEIVNFDERTHINKKPIFKY